MAGAAGSGGIVDGGFWTMTWFQAVVGVTGAGGVSGVLWKLLRSRRVRAAVADVLDGQDRGGETHEELRSLLYEQRQTLETLVLTSDHLGFRVRTLEDDVAALSRRLAETRRREQNLARKLREERKQSAEQIAALRSELDEARRQIADLEEQLARYRPDGRVPE